MPAASGVRLLGSGNSFRSHIVLAGWNPKSKTSHTARSRKRGLSKHGDARTTSTPCGRCVKRIRAFIDGPPSDILTERVSCVRSAHEVRVLQLASNEYHS